LDRYFSLIISNFSDNGLIVIDDIRWSTDMYRSWKKLLGHPSVTISLEFREIGVLFINSKHTRQHYILENPY